MRRIGRVIPLLLVIATIAVYWPILTHDFVSLDDSVTVYDNLNLVRLSGNSLYVFWTSPQIGLYAPLTYSLYALICLFARIRPRPPGHAAPFVAWPFHAVSIMLHVLCVLVVYRLLRRLIGPRWPAAAGALLFAVHPVQVETVAWVTAINGLLCSTLALTAVLLYLRSMPAMGPQDATVAVLSPRNRRGQYILATEVFIFAMLAKPLGVITPLLAAIAYWMVRRHRLWHGRPAHVFDRETSATRRAHDNAETSTENESAPPRLPAVPMNLVFWFVLAIPMAMVARISQPVPDWWVSVPVWFRPFVAGDALAFYLYKLAFPRTLTPDYNRPPHAIYAGGAAFYTWIVPAVLGLGIFFLMRRRRRIEPLLAGALWFVVGLLPVLGLTTFAFQKMSTVADRYLYLPMFGVALCTAWGLQQLTRQDFNSRYACRWLRPAVVIVALATLASLAARTSFQLRYWQNTDTLTQHSKSLIHREPGTRGVV